VLSSGARRVPRQIPGNEQRHNVSMLETRFDHENLKAALDSKIKNLTVFGLNMESLETISTIRREYPKVNITVIDDNIESYIQVKYGEEVAKSLIQ
jgi:hypothetical protein